MNHDPVESRMRELSWRRTLTAAEAAELRGWQAAHPEAAAQWSEEVALNSLLDRLPDAPVPTNFTSRVMEDIEREAATAARQPARTPQWWQRILLPRLAFAAVILGGGLILYQRNLTNQREQGTAPLIAVSETRELLSMEVLQDFDSIAELGPATAGFGPRVQPDTELLSLMQ